MRNLVLLLLSITLFVSCSDDDDDNIQDFTSFVFYTTEDLKFPNCIAAYKKDGNYYKIGELGTLEKDKQSSEIRVTDNTIKEIYLFSDYCII
ncbi:MAG: hypothetical protein E6772_07235 [Dysgonomonas sp.]|nr:hypothetical protein [Dysgonomonas sp.]